MKQGHATESRSGSTKTEPISKAVNPAYVAQLGIKERNITAVPMYEGRGLEAPKVTSTNHKSGSQGRY